MFAKVMCIVLSLSLNDSPRVQPIGGCPSDYLTQQQTLLMFSRARTSAMSFTYNLLSLHLPRFTVAEQKVTGSALGINGQSRTTALEDRNTKLMIKYFAAQFT